MREVELPDGRILEIPSDLSNDQKAFFRKQFGGDSTSASTDDTSTLSKVSKFGKEALKTADYAIRSGVFGIPNLARDVGKAANAFAKEQGAPEFLTDDIPGMKPLLELADKVMVPPKPDTDLGKKVGDIGAATVGGMMAPGSMATNAALGMGSGVGAELSAEMFGDNPIARVVGGMLGGGMTGAAITPKTNRANLAQEALADVEPDDLSRAVVNQKNAADQGIPINLSQAMDQPSNIDTYVDALASNPQGKQITKQLRDQPHNISGKVQHELHKLPGSVRSPHSIADEAQEAATSVLTELRSKGSDLWDETFGASLDKVQKRLMDESRKASTIYNNKQPLTPQEALRQATHVPKEKLNDIYEDLTALADSYPTQTGKHKLIMELRGTLKQGDDFITDARMLEENFKDFKGNLGIENLANRNMNTIAGKFVAGKANEVRERIGDSLEAYRDANAVWKRYTDEVYNPAKKSIIGRLAGRTGAKVDVEAPLTKLRAVLNDGTSPFANKQSSEILKIEKEFSKIGQGNVFEDAVKTHMAEKVTKALGSADERVNPNIASALRKSFGAPQINDSVSRGTREQLIGLARSQGIKDENAYAKGFKNFMTVVAKASRRPGQVSGANTKDIVDEASSSLWGRLGQVSIMTPIRQPALAWSTFLRDDSLATMDRLLSSPEGVSTLILLGKQPKMNRAAQTALTSFFATNANVMANKPVEEGVQ